MVPLMSIFFPLGEVKLLKCWGFSLGKHLQAIYTSKPAETHIPHLQPLSRIHGPDISGCASVALSGGSELWPWAGFEAAGTRLVFTSSLGLAVAPSVFRASVPIYCPNWEKPQKRAFFLSPPEWILVPQPLRDTSHKVPPMT